MSMSGHGLVLMLAIVGASEAFASPIDPQGVFDKSIRGIPVSRVDAFDFQSDDSGGGAFNFMNVSGEHWTELIFHASLPPDSIIACGPGPFFRVCRVSSAFSPFSPTADFTIAFTGGPGISNNEIFSFNLNDDIDGQPNLDQFGAGGWGSRKSLHVETIAGPEPATWLLLGGGVGLLGVLRRVRRSRRS